MHVGIAKHDLPRRMRVAAKHVELQCQAEQLFQVAGQMRGAVRHCTHLDAGVIERY